MAAIPPSLDALYAHGLIIVGTCPTTPQDGFDAGTLVLIGPDGARFWPIVTASPEYQDQQPDPIDRWSRRVIGQLADAIGAPAFFPFGAPPYHPFYQWATRSGRAWPSPVSLLVHAEQGLFISYRGAILLPGPMPTPSLQRPCDTCAQPCLSACPVNALGPDGYDVAACHAFLNTPAGSDCLMRGCAVRRSCPVGQDLRPEAQSAYHMRRFHP